MLPAASGMAESLCANSLGESIVATLAFKRRVINRKGGLGFSQPTLFRSFHRYDYEAAMAPEIFQGPPPAIVGGEV